MTREGAKITLTYLWWVWGMLLFGLLIVFSLLPATQHLSTDALSWFLPNLLPVLTLVGAASYKEGQSTASQKRKPAGPLLPIAIGLSIAYLAALSACVAVLFLSGKPVEAVQPTSLFLGPLQAAVTTFLGLFFVTGKS